MRPIDGHRFGLRAAVASNIRGRMVSRLGLTLWVRVRDRLGNGCRDTLIANLKLALERDTPRARDA